MSHSTVLFALLAFGAAYVAGVASEPWNGNAMALFAQSAGYRGEVMEGNVHSSWAGTHFVERRQSGSNDMCSCPCQSFPCCCQCFPNNVPKSCCCQTPPNSLQSSQNGPTGISCSCQLAPTPPAPNPTPLPCCEGLSRIAAIQGTQCRQCNPPPLPCCHGLGAQLSVGTQCRQC